MSKIFLAVAAALCAASGCTSQSAKIEPVQHTASRSEERSAGQAATWTPTPSSTPSSQPIAEPSSSPRPVTSTAASAPSTPNSSAVAAGGAAAPAMPVVPDRVLRVSTVGGHLKFDPPRLDAYAGQTVEIVFENNSPASSGSFHNWVLVKPGSEPAVAALGKDAGVDPGAATYSPSVLAATRTVGPGQASSVDFAAPDLPGDYPFVSMVGDEWKVMRGVLVVHPISEELSS